MKVLVVEDEHKIANSIKRGLEQEGYPTDVAFDGLEGYDLASSEPYDVIILDLMLPQMDGLSIVKKLRKENLHTPILILTAKGQLDDKIEGLNGGADDYLTKPFAFTELLARLKALTRRPKESFGKVLKIKNLTLDPVSYEVNVDGKNINLSKKEYTLLEYLMRHPGKLVSKEQIINGVWDYDSDILPNTVEVYVGYLRNKIGKEKIQTLRGFGYKMEKEKNVL